MYLYLGLLNSIHIPFVPLLGLIFFVVWYLVDCHLLLNLYKGETASSGWLVHNACNKVMFALVFF